MYGDLQFEHSSTVDRAADEIRRAIFAGQLDPGTPAARGRALRGHGRRAQHHPGGARRPGRRRGGGPGPQQGGGRQGAVGPGRQRHQPGPGQPRVLGGTALGRRSARGAACGRPSGGRRLCGPGSAHLGPGRPDRGAPADPPGPRRPDRQRAAAGGRRRLRRRAPARPGPPGPGARQHRRAGRRATASWSSCSRPATSTRPIAELARHLAAAEVSLHDVIGHGTIEP